MIKDLRDWKKESERKNKNKHQWGWFQHPNTGNVEYNIGFFNHVTGADGGDTSVLAGSVGDGGMGESLDMNDKVELYYDDIEVSGYYGPIDWETGYPKKEYNETVSWVYTVDRDDIFVDLEEFIESPELSDEQLEKIVSENFEELVDKYYQQLLDKYRERAEEDANENYEYDEYDHYLDAMGESVNIREALNKIDCNTCGKYDLLNMYDCSDMSLEKKAKLAEMLKENVSADKLYEYMDEESPWQIGLELFADNGHEYKVISVLDEREVDGYELSIVGAIGNELSNADEEVYFVLLDSDIEWGPVDTAEEALEWASDVQDGYYTQEDNFDYDDDYDDEYTGIEERLTPSGREKLVSDKTMSLAVEAARTIDPNAKGDYDDDFIYGDDGHGGSTWEILLNGDGKAYSTWGRNAVLTSKVEKAVNDAADVYWAEQEKKWKDGIARLNANGMKESEEDGLENAAQEFTSANTSINSARLPAIFNMGGVHFNPDTINLDYGGGKFDNATDELASKGVTNLVYDPYNRSASHNSEVIKTIKEHGGADTATCSNVLNVIKEPAARTVVIKNIYKLLKPNGVAYFTVYEGTGKGDEGPTKAGYQLNKKTADYVEEISSVFPSVSRRGKLIVASKGTSVTEEFDDDWSDTLETGGIRECATSESGVEMKKGLASSKNLSKGITSHRGRSKSPKYLKEADNYGYVVYTLTLVDDNGNTYTEQDSIPATEFDNNPDLDPVEYLQEYYDDRIIEISAGEYINETLLRPNKESIKKACRRGNAMNEGALKEIDLEVQEAGGVGAYIDSLESQLRGLSREMRFLRGQARREMKAGGAYDSVDEINDALTSTVKEYNEVRKKYDYISSQQTGGVN